MSNEIQTTEKESRLKDIALVANQGPQLKTMGDVWAVAQMYHAAGMMPTNVKTPQQLLVILTAGAELGFGPTFALRNLAAFNGQALLHSDGPISLVLRSGLLEWQKSGYDGKPDTDGYTAWFEVKRKGYEDSLRRTFSVAEAKAAALWGKAIWKQYPNRMLLARARAFALRDQFADVLGGFGILEEYQGGEQPTVEPETATTGSAGLLNALRAPTESPESDGSEFEAPEGQPDDSEPVDAEYAPLSDEPAPEEIEEIRAREHAEAQEQGLFGVRP